MGVLKDYNPDRVIVTFAGVPIDGFAPDDMITISKVDTKVFKTVVGTTGEVARSRSLDRTHQVTIRLLQTSDSNAALSAISNADKFGENGVGVAPLHIKDLNGASLWEADQAYIDEEPEVTLGPEASVREWKIMCADMRRTDAGT